MTATVVLWINHVIHTYPALCLVMLASVVASILFAMALFIDRFGPRPLIIAAFVFAAMWDFQ